MGINWNFRLKSYHITLFDGNRDDGARHWRQNHARQIHLGSLFHVLSKGMLILGLDKDIKLDIV